MKIMAFLISFLILASIVFPIELWNGLDTNMSKADLIAKVMELIKATEYWDSSGGYYSRNKPLLEDLIIYGDYSRDRQFPPKLTVCYFKTDIPPYINAISRDPSLGLFFYENKLLAVVVFYALNFNDIFNVAKNNFGNPNQIVTANNYSEVKIHIWQQESRSIYLPSNGNLIRYMGLPMYFVNQGLVNEYVNLQNMRREQEQREAEQKKQQAIDAIKF
jgi:hypothetical protein